MNNHAVVAEFWDWFCSIAEVLSVDIDNSKLIEELDDRVHQLGAEFSWELGPGLSKAWQFVISPNLNRELLDETRWIVSLALDLRDWEFYPARHPKEWDYKFQLESSDMGQPIHLDASEWTFVLLRYPDGAHEVLLSGKNLPVLNENQRWQAASITLESILGEEIILERIREFELVDHLEPRFAEQQKPIQHLQSLTI
jgi:hypothetical protein